jgi:hypothetical protein
LANSGGFGPRISGIIGDQDGFGTAVTGRDARLPVCRFGELAAGLEPVSVSFGKCPEEHAVEAGQFRPLVAEPGGRGVENVVDRGDRIGVLNRRCTGQQVKCGGSQRVLVGAPVDIGAHQLFGRGVADRPGRGVSPGGA